MGETLKLYLDQMIPSEIAAELRSKAMMLSVPQRLARTAQMTSKFFKKQFPKIVF